MKSTIARLMLLAPVLSLLTACPRPDRTVIAKGPRAVYVTVEAHFDKDGKPKIEKHYHDTELVRPGDTLEFRCECDQGIEFKVSEPRLVANKDAFWNDLLRENPGATREHVKEALESLGGPVEASPIVDAHKLEVEAPTSAVGPPVTAAPGQPDPDVVVFLRRFLQDFQKVIPHHLPAAELFADWREPDFHPGDVAIGPFEVDEMDPEQTFAATWKFSWTIRKAGEERSSEWDVLDPHIEEEPHPKKF